MKTAEELANRIKAEILADVRDSIVPAEVGSYAELCDYVDADLYGDSEELLDELDAAAPDAEGGHRAALTTLYDIAEPAMEIVDAWIKAGGIKAAITSTARSGSPYVQGETPCEFALVKIDKLIELEGEEPALGWKFGLNRFLRGQLSKAELAIIPKDVATITFWRSVYEGYLGNEKAMFERPEAVIKLWKPPINGHFIADGFHRLCAAKLAGLSVIAANLAPMYRNT